MSDDLAEYVDDDGGRCVVVFDGGPHLADQLDDTLALGSWGGVALNVVYRKSHRWWPSTTLTAGWTYEYVPEVPLRVLFVVGGPAQSNGEARALRTEARAIVNADIILRNTYPYDENMTGPGGDQCGGPLLPMADQLMTRLGPGGEDLYDRACIVSLASGSQSLSDQYGTDGTDGTMALQINQPDVLGGIEGDTLANGAPIEGPPTLMRPGDDYVLHVNIGEADAGGGNIETWAAECMKVINWFMEAFPSCNCRGISIAVLAPTEELGAGNPDDQERWTAVLQHQLSLKDQTASPPRVTVRYLDSDKKPGDEIHYHMAAQERMGEDCANALVDDTQFGGLVPVDAIRFRGQTPSDPETPLEANECRLVYEDGVLYAHLVDEDGDVVVLRIAQASVIGKSGRARPKPRRRP